MKELVLDPDECMHSEGPRVHHGKPLRELEQAILNDSWHEVPAVYVVQSERIPGKYIIYNGNRRLHIAKLFNKPLKAKLIESQKDFKQMNYDDIASWHVTPWYHEKPEGVPDTSGKYEHLVMKVCDWALHCTAIPTYETKEIGWDTPNKSRLEELLTEANP